MRCSAFHAVFGGRDGVAWRRDDEDRMWLIASETDLDPAVLGPVHLLRRDEERERRHEKQRQQIGAHLRQRVGLADALVHGKAICIEGGDYRLNQGKFLCCLCGQTGGVPEGENLAEICVECQGQEEEVDKT